MKKQNNAPNNSSECCLPWDTTDESMAILSQDVMERVLKLGLSERNFTVAATELDGIEFNFKTYIPVAMKLLSLDANLSHMHSKLSPKMDEEIFWRNYYRRTMFLRAIVGMDGDHPSRYKILYFAAPINRFIVS